MTDKKLRIYSVTIHVSLVLDDGEEMEPGPNLNPVTLPLSKAREMLTSLPEEVAALAEQITAADPAMRSPSER